MRFYINPISDGLAYTTKDGVHAIAAPGSFLDTAQAHNPLPAGWVPPPDVWTLFPVDAAAQTALQNAVATAKAALSPSGSVVPGLPGGFPTSIPLYPFSA